MSLGVTQLMVALKFVIFVAILKKCSMQTITLKIKNHKDYYLLKEIAERLGIVIIEQGQEPEQEKRKWDFIGTADLKGRLDNENIRDFAHE